VELKSNSLKNIINNFKENEMLSKSFSAFVLKIIGSLLGYVFLLLVTRTAGAQAWGVFALCLAVLNIVSIISRFGLDIALLRYIPEYLPDLSKVRDLVKKGIWLVFILSVGISFGLYFLSGVISNTVFQKPNLFPFIQIISFALIPFSLSLVIAQSFRGLKEIGYFAFFSQPARYVFAIIFFFSFSYFGLIEQGKVPIYSYVTGMFCVFFFGARLLLRKIDGFKDLTFSISISRMIKTASPMMLSSSIYLLIASIDTIMIGIYSNESDVGIYNVAIRVSGLVAFSLAAISSISAPKFSETYNNADKEGFKKVVHESSRLIFLSTIPIIIILAIFNKYILLFFGNEFIAGAGVLYVLLLGQFSNTFSGSLGFILQMTGNEKIFRNILTLALIINIVLNLILIPEVGIIGAAIASASSLIIWNILSLIYIKKEFGFWTFEKNMSL
jgi:O-antigen/teichoic acid export membrane protein